MDCRFVPAANHCAARTEAALLTHQVVALIAAPLGSDAVNPCAAGSEWRLLLVASSAYAVGIFSSWAMPVQVDELIEHFSKSAPQAGLLATSQMLFLGFAAFIAPSAGHRLSAPQLGALGCILAAAGFSIAGISKGSEITLWLAFALCGIGQGMAGAAGSALAATSRQPVRLFAEVAGGASAYAAIWLFVIPHFRPRLPSIPLSFWMCAAATALCGVLVAFFGSTLSAHIPNERATGFWNLKRSALLLLAGSFMVFAPAQALWSFADQFGERLDVPATQIGVLLFVSTLAGVVGPLAAPVLAQKWGNYLAISSVVALTAMACVLGATTHVIPVFVTAIIGLAFLQMALVPLLFGMAVNLDANGGVAPFVYGSILFGCSVGPLLGGIAYEPTGYCLAAVCLVLCGLSWTMIRRARPY